MMVIRKLMMVAGRLAMALGAEVTHTTDTAQLKVCRRYTKNA